MVKFEEVGVERRKNGLTPREVFKSRSPWHTRSSRRYFWVVRRTEHRWSSEVSFLFPPLKTTRANVQANLADASRMLGEQRCGRLYAAVSRHSSPPLKSRKQSPPGWYTLRLFTLGVKVCTSTRWKKFSGKCFLVVRLFSASSKAKRDQNLYYEKSRVLIRLPSHRISLVQISGLISDARSPFERGNTAVPPVHAA